MTDEEKELLIKDICARLPYDVIVQETFQDAQRDVPVWDCGPHYIKDHPEKVKPYLRPMSSMTEEEKSELKEILDAEEVDCDSFGYSEGGTVDYYISSIPYSLCGSVVDWLIEKMFDYRGLIPMNLALPAPDGMYNKKEEGE